MPQYAYIEAYRSLVFRIKYGRFIIDYVVGLFIESRICRRRIITFDYLLGTFIRGCFAILYKTVQVQYFWEYHSEKEKNK